MPGSVAGRFALLRRGWNWEWKTAHRLFSLHEEGLWAEDDTFVSRLGMIRNLAGLAIVVAVSFRAGGIHNQEFDPVNRLGFLFVALVITAITVVVTAAFILPAIKPGPRGQVARRLVIPVRTMAVYLGVLALPFIVGFSGYYLSLLLYRSINGGGSRHLAAVLAVFTVGGTAEMITIGFALLALLGSVISVGSLFRADEGYPLLGPVTVVAVVWVQLIVLQIATHDSIPSETAGLLLYFGGPVSVTALSVMEIARLRQVPGLDLRGAPPSRPLPRGPRQHFTGTATLLSMLGGGCRSPESSWCSSWPRSPRIHPAGRPRNTSSRRCEPARSARTARLSQRARWAARPSCSAPAPARSRRHCRYRTATRPRWRSAPRAIYSPWRRRASR